jgi:hypothetical protein
MPPIEPRSFWLRIVAVLTIVVFALFLVLRRGRLW